MHDLDLGAGLHQPPRQPRRLAYDARALQHPSGALRPRQEQSRTGGQHSPYASYDVLEYSDDEVAAQVNYADGTALVLYVAPDDGGQSWSVRAFDRLAR